MWVLFVGMETYLQMQFCKMKGRHKVFLGFHSCPCSLLTPWFSQFPGRPWATVLHGMSFPSPGIFLFVYWKGLWAPDRRTVFLQNHQVTWLHMQSSQLQRKTIPLASAELPLGPLGGTALAGVLYWVLVLACGDPVSLPYICVCFLNTQWARNACCFVDI